MSQIQNFSSLKTSKPRNVQAPKRPNPQASQPQNVPSLKMPRPQNIPASKRPKPQNIQAPKHPKYKMSQASKRPRPQNIQAPKRPNSSICGPYSFQWKYFNNVHKLLMYKHPHIQNWRIFFGKKAKNDQFCRQYTVVAKAKKTSNIRLH